MKLQVQFSKDKSRARNRCDIFYFLRFIFRYRVFLFHSLFYLTLVFLVRRAAKMMEIANILRYIEYLCQPAVWYSSLVLCQLLVYHTSRQATANSPCTRLAFFENDLLIMLLMWLSAFYSSHFRMISNLLDGIIVLCTTDIIWLPLSFFCLAFFLFFSLLLRPIDEHGFRFHLHFYCAVIMTMKWK